MTSSLLPLIETMAKEKGVEPQVIIAALEDAMLTASRKAYKSTEDLRSRMNQETGQIEIFAVKHIVEAVENPATEISLQDAKEMYGEDAELDMEIEFPKPPVESRIAAQTVKQVLSQKIREAEREKVYDEFNQRIGEVVTAVVKRFETGDIVAEIGPRRSDAAPPRAVARRELQHRRSRPRRDQVGEQERQGPAGRAVAHRPGPADQAVRAGSAGDLRRHRGDPRRRARSRRSRQGRGLLARARRRSGRRLRRHEGHARPGDHPRAARREDRHRRVVR